VPTRPAGYRVTRSARGVELFPSPATLLRTDRLPTLANRVHSLVPHLPFGVPSSVLLAAPFGAAVLPGFHPSSRHHRWHPQSRDFPVSRCVPSSGFLSLSTVSATIGFTGLFHPAATSRVVTVQGLLPSHSRPGSSPGRAPLPLPSERSPASRLPPSNAPTSRLCSVDRCVPQERGLAFPGVAPLFGFVLPQVLFTRLGPDSPGPPLVTFPAPSSSPA